jgi:competence protein ComEC
MLLLAATAAGILIDRALDTRETVGWITMALASVTASCLMVRRSWPSIAMLLAGVAALAAGWHHFWWDDQAPTDLAAGATEQPAPGWLRGAITERLGLRQGEGYGPGDSARVTTRLVVEVGQVCDGTRWRPAAGRALVVVSGDRSDLHAGEPVEVAGQLSRVPGPLNPGEFDYRAFLRARGIRLRLAVDSPAGIAVDPAGSLWPATFWLGRLREACRARLLARLGAGTEPLAAALILGQREEIDPEVNDAFARTGTTHLLAISGLQLQALAVALGWLFRLLGFPRRLAYGGVGLITLGYALLVGLAPSVVRSAAMTLTFCLAALVARPTRPANTLALAGLVTLWMNPFHLFDVGCQLSFLAIAALIWLVPLAREGLSGAHLAIRTRLLGAPSPLEELRRRFEPRWRRAGRRALRGMGLLVLSSLVVWLATLPLVALRFHLLSPIGVLLNLPLIPLTSLALLLGAAGMALGLAWAPLEIPLIVAADVLLRLTDAIVRWGVAQPWGHRFVAGPPWGSVLTFYVALAFATMCALAAKSRAPVGTGSRLRRAAPWCAVAASLVPGWLITWPEGPRRLEGDVLAVGHGLAVLLRLPDGSTLLYDCGRMGDPSVGRRIIAPALWARGQNRIDSVYLSHADQDHADGLPDLLDRFRIGEVVIPPGFVSESNPGAELLLHEAARHGVPVRTIAAPASWHRCGVAFAVLHPPADWHPDSSDNARSLVLDVASEGRHLLLTGDLDQLGTLALTAQQPIGPIDLFLAPHHGGKSANTWVLYEWASPRTVMVSQRPFSPGTTDALTPFERGGMPLLRTWQSGAVHFQWRSNGIITEGFLKPCRSGPIAAPARGGRDDTR